MAWAAGPSAGLASVSIGPGWMLLMVIPRGASSRARPRVRLASAPLVKCVDRLVGERRTVGVDAADVKGQTHRQARYEGGSIEGDTGYYGHHLIRATAIVIGSAGSCCSTQRQLLTSDTRARTSRCRLPRTSHSHRRN